MKCFKNLFWILITFLLILGGCSQQEINKTDEVEKNTVEKNEVEKNEVIVKQDDVVTIQDKNLEILIRETLDIDSNTRDLIEKDMEDLISLSSEKVDVDLIKSLKGLELAKNLEEIQFLNQTIEDLSPLKELPLLNDIYINGEKFNKLYFLNDKEKEQYANYIVTLEGSSHQRVIYGSINDVDKNGIKDMVIVTSEKGAVSDNIPVEDIHTNYVYVKVLTISNGKVQTLYETEKGNAVEFLIEEGSTDFPLTPEIYIKEGEYFEFLIKTSGNIYRTQIDNYRLFTLKEDLSTEESEIIKSVYTCPNDDEECNNQNTNGEETSIKILQGNILLKDVDEFINSSKIIQIYSANSVESEFINRLREFSTVNNISSSINEKFLDLIVEEEAMINGEVINLAKGMYLQDLKYLVGEADSNESISGISYIKYGDVTLTVVDNFIEVYEFSNLNISVELFFDRFGRNTLTDGDNSLTFITNEKGYFLIVYFDDKDIVHSAKYAYVPDY